MESAIVVVGGGVVGGVAAGAAEGRGSDMAGAEATKTDVGWLCGTAVPAKRYRREGPVRVCSMLAATAAAGTATLLRTRKNHEKRSDQRWDRNSSCNCWEGCVAGGARLTDCRSCSPREMWTGREGPYPVLSCPDLSYLLAKSAGANSRQILATIEVDRNR